MIELETSSLTALVRIKHQYGQEVIQPVCPVAQEFAGIAGTKVLTPKTIESMKKLGYVIEVEQTLPRTLWTGTPAVLSLHDTTPDRPDIAQTPPAPSLTRPI